MNPATPNPTDTASPNLAEPAFQPATAPSTTPAGEDPGKGLAIAGIVLAFFFSLVGLILSIIAKKKSKAAGFNNTLATVGIVLNSIFLALGLLVILLLIMITVVAYGGIQERSKDSSAQSSAMTLLKKTEAYNANFGNYPVSIGEMNQDDASTVSDGEYYEVSPVPVTKSTARKTTGAQDKDVLNLYTCGLAGNKIAYWNFTDDVVTYLYSGLASSDSRCSLVVN